MCVFFWGPQVLGDFPINFFFPLKKTLGSSRSKGELVSPGLNIGFQVDVQTLIYGDLLGQISARQKFRRKILRQDVFLREVW